MTDWIMPDPSLDEDDRFHVATIIPKNPDDPAVYIAIIGPSGYGCMYCGGPYDGLLVAPAENERGRPTKIACCLAHKSFCSAWIMASRRR
jgi:hypothetical protein